jgi:hypothetical protein
MKTNKNDANKAAVLEALGALRRALAAEPDSPLVTRTLEQCDRLELAIQQFHAEGLRFAAFTLLRLVTHNGTSLTETVRSATHGLKTALESAGYPH